jgi:hypothetical protein
MGALTNEMRDAGIIEKVKRSGVIWIRLLAWNPDWMREQVPGITVTRVNATDPPTAIGERIQALVMMNKGREFVLKRVGSELWIAAMPPQSNLLGVNN